MTQPAGASNLNLRIDDDDRIGLLGANGNGKSTFAKLIAGRLDPFDGVLKSDPRLKSSATSPSTSSTSSPVENALRARPRAPHARCPEATVRSRVDGMGLARSKMEHAGRDLSGGEKARLLMGLATFDGANLLILDEPTNHLDIDSRSALVEALAEFVGAVILISHDRHLVEASVDRLWLVADGTVDPFDGDLDDYRRSVLDCRSAEASERSRPAPAGPASRQRRREAALKRRETAPLRRRIGEIEAWIDRLNVEISEIDRKLADPDLYARDPTDAAFLAKTRAHAAQKLATAEDEWLSMTAKIEAKGG
jgi:ATP-binding cassette, subfamily F, member 3